MIEERKHQMSKGVELIFAGRSICENATGAKFVDEQRSGNEIHCC